MTAWCRTGDKSTAGPIMDNGYWRIYPSLSLDELTHANTTQHVTTLTAHACTNSFNSQESPPPPPKQGSWGQHGVHWSRQDPGGPHVGPINFAIWVIHIIGDSSFAVNIRKTVQNNFKEFS